MPIGSQQRLSPRVSRARAKNVRPHPHALRALCAPLFRALVATFFFAEVAIDQFQRPVQHADGAREGQHFASAPLFPRTIIRANFRFAEDAVSEPRREDDANLERLGVRYAP